MISVKVKHYYIYIVSFRSQEKAICEEIACISTQDKERRGEVFIDINHFTSHFPTTLMHLMNTVQ